MSVPMSAREWWRLHDAAGSPPELDARSVPCPSCGARIGAYCQRPSGHKAWSAHAARWDDAVCALEPVKEEAPVYGFDHDPEVAAGYQDADLMTLELDELGREEPPPELVLELESGQIALRADVEERNGQQVLEELAPPAKPAPCTFERDATEELARRQLEELAPSAYVLELEDGTREELTEAGPVISAGTIAEDDRRARGVVLFNGQEITREAYDRIRGKTTPRHLCAYCGAELKPEHWIYSRHTGARYCWPGEGCNVPTQYRASGPNVRLALEELERAGEEG